LAAVQFTGNAVTDFSDTSFDSSSGRTHNFGVLRVLDTQYDSNGLPILPLVPDVGVPDEFAHGTVSGWDMRSIYFQYDDLKDTLMIGIDCFGICGDADGDGDAGHTSATLDNIGGLDMPNLAQTESFVISIDLNLDVADVLPSFTPGLIVPFDYIIGVPGGQPATAQVNPGPGEVPYLPCTQQGQSGDDLFGMQQCFGLYNYQLTASVPLARRMLSVATQSNGSAWPATNFNPGNALNWPVAAQPNLEWTIGNIIALRATKGAGFTRSNKEPWSLLIQAFSGSFQDAGIGEDYIPSQNDYLNVQFPCLQLDACDVCLGDSSTCLDCAGVPNGPSVYDVCDVCGGDGSSCRDCKGIPNGPHQYEVLCV